MGKAKRKHEEEMRSEVLLQRPSNRRDEPMDIGRTQEEDSEKMLICNPEFGLTSCHYPGDVRTSDHRQLLVPLSSISMSSRVRRQHLRSHQLSTTSKSLRCRRLSTAFGLTPKPPNVDPLVGGAANERARNSASNVDVSEGQLRAARTLTFPDGTEITIQ